MGKVCYDRKTDLIGSAQNCDDSKNPLDRVLYEIKSRDVTDIMGHFAQVNLRSPNVLIIGPKEKLEQFSSEPGLNFIYFDDLASEDNSMLRRAPTS